jgi:hypothetical protein
MVRLLLLMMIRVFGHIQSGSHRQNLIYSWLISLALLIPLSNLSKNPSGTVQRKYFHLAALLMFGPAMYLDVGRRERARECDFLSSLKGL